MRDQTPEECNRRTSRHRRRNDPLPEISIKYLPISDLRDPKHPVRAVKKKQVTAVRRGIEELGYCSPILVSRDKEVIDGTNRVAALREMGQPTAPCICVDHLDERELRLLRIALNKIQETGTWDEEALKLELAYQLEFNTDLTILGFEPPELDTLFEISSGEVEGPDPADDFEEVPPSDAPTVTQEGDVWVLGDHLICCGNGRDADLVKALCGTTAIDLVFTDPPYNVRINGHVRARATGFAEFAEASGEMSEEEFTEFLASFIGVANQVRRPGALYYVFMDWRHMDGMRAAIRGAGFEQINLCTWVKPNGGMGSFYRSRHELVFVFREPDVAHVNNIQLGRHGRYRTNVWEYAGATGGRGDEEDDFSLHPTVKPVRLVADAILDSTAIGNTVFDPFLGSGTTLLAAERTQRRAIGIEIAPAYVDVAIRRWEKMTGREAVHRETGATFATRGAGLGTGTTTGAITGTMTGHSAEEF